MDWFFLWLIWLKLSEDKTECKSETQVVDIKEKDQSPFVLCFLLLLSVPCLLITLDSKGVVQTLISGFMICLTSIVTTFLILIIKQIANRFKTKNNSH